MEIHKDKNKRSCPNNESYWRGSSLIWRVMKLINGKMAIQMKSAILEDFKNNESYIVTSKDSTLIGTAMFSTKKEPTYKSIEGKWITKSDAKYGVIHRMAVTNESRKKGVAKFIFEQCEQQLFHQNNINSMRIDTHEDNLAMQSLLKKLKYLYCGVIYLDNGDKRLAYEKLIKI